MALKTAHSGIKDSGEFFEIIPRTRSVVVPSDYQVIGTVGERNSEQVTIKCPKIIDGHDICGCELHYVMWENAEGVPGKDTLNYETPDGDFVFFKWTVRGALTLAVGNISFSIHFEDPNDDESLAYKFSTTTCKACKILDSLKDAREITYKSMYVTGSKLVIADYAHVSDKKLKINSL